MASLDETQHVSNIFLHTEGTELHLDKEDPNQQVHVNQCLVLFGEHWKDQSLLWCQPATNVMGTLDLRKNYWLLHGRLLWLHHLQRGRTRDRRRFFNGRNSWWVRSCSLSHETMLNIGNPAIPEAPSPDLSPLIVRAPCPFWSLPTAFGAPTRLTCPSHWVQQTVRLEDSNELKGCRGCLWKESKWTNRQSFLALEPFPVSQPGVPSKVFNTDSTEHQ